MVLNFELNEEDSEAVVTEPTSKVVLNASDLGPGTLTITNNSISWRSSDPEPDLIRCLNFTYTDIILFAISKDNPLQSECLYVLLDKPTKDLNQDSGIGDVINRLQNGHLDEAENEEGNENDIEGEAGVNDDDDDDDEDGENGNGENSEELFIMLENSDRLKPIYDVLLQCQNLNPDPSPDDFNNWDESDSENADDDDDEFDSGYANNEGSNNNGLDEHFFENGNNRDDYEELMEDDDDLVLAVDDNDEDGNDSLYEDAD